MKKLLVSFLFTLFLSAPLFAQEAPKHLSPEAENYCTELTRAMAAEIQLNEAEFIVLKSLNREMMLKSEEIKSTYVNDAATKEKKMKEIIAGFNSKLTPVLRPYQLQAFSHISLSANTWTVSDSKKIAISSK